MRRLIGAAVIAWSLYLFYQSGSALNAYVALGAPLNEAIGDPAFVLPLLGSALALAGGLLAVFSLPFGAVFALLGGLLFVVLGGAAFALGADASLFAVELSSAAFFLASAVGLAVLRRG